MVSPITPNEEANQKREIQSNVAIHSAGIFLLTQLEEDPTFSSGLIARRAVE
jgi:hypothetical protein